MLDQERSHNPNEGLQINLSEAMSPSLASTGSPIIPRTTNDRRSYFPDRALAASPALLHRISTANSMRNSTASRSDGRLQKYLRDADMFEGDAQQRANLARYPSNASSIGSYQERKVGGRPLTPSLDQYSENFSSLDRAQEAISDIGREQPLHITKKPPVYIERIETSRFSTETMESSETIMRMASPAPDLATPRIPTVKILGESPVPPHGKYALRESFCPPAGYKTYSPDVGNNEFAVPPTPAAKASPFQFQHAVDNHVREVDIGDAHTGYNDLNNSNSPIFHPQQNPFDDHKNKALPGTPVGAYHSVQTHRKSQGFVESPTGHRYPAEVPRDDRMQDVLRNSADTTKYYLEDGRIQRVPPGSHIHEGYRSSFLEDRSLENVQFNPAAQSTGISTYNEKGLGAGNDRPRVPLWKRPFVWIFFIVLLLLIAGGVVAAVLLWKRHEGIVNANIPGGFLVQPTNLKNSNATALGTSIVTLAVSAGSISKRASGNISTNYVNFHQLASGEIRMTMTNNSEWQTPELVTSDAHTGTPIAAFTTGSMTGMTLFYFDQNKILQELRMNKDARTWKKGTIGNLNATSNAPSGLTVQYVGKCQESEVAWLVYHTGKGDAAQLLSWNEKQDKWSASNTFHNVKQGAGFTSLHDSAVWRFYYTDSHSSQLTEQVCPECCASMNFKAWKTGIVGPRVLSKTGGMSAVGVGVSRLIYYQDSDGTIRELNSTGNISEEIWATKHSTKKGTFRRARERRAIPSKQSKSASATSAVASPGVAIAKASPNSKMSLTTGISENTRRLALFYQGNNTDITIQTRGEGADDSWSIPTTLPSDH